MSDKYAEFVTAVEAYELALSASKIAEARAVAARHRATEAGDEYSYSQYREAFELSINLADAANTIHPRRVFRGRAEMFDLALDYFAGPAEEDKDRIRPGLASFILGDKPKES